MGHGEITFLNFPKRIEGLEFISKIAVGASSCAAIREGKLLIWGVIHSIGWSHSKPFVCAEDPKLFSLFDSKKNNISDVALGKVQKQKKSQTSEIFKN